MTKVVANTQAMDSAALQLQQQHESLQQQVLQVWQSLTTAANALPTFANSEEPRQALGDTIPSLTRILALRKIVADTLADDSKNVKNLEGWAQSIIGNL